MDLMAYTGLSIEARVERLRTTLVKKHPFFGHIACFLEWVVSEDPSMKTACTDGTKVWWDSEFVKNNTDDILSFVCVHEIEHVIKRHPWRRGERDPFLWNVACDYHINGELKGYDIKIPKNALYDPQYDGMLEEAIYDSLLENSIQVSVDGMGGDFVDAPKGKDEETDGEVERRINHMVESAVKRCMDAGKLPGWLQKFIDQYRTAQVNWKAKLRMQVEPLFPRDVTWSTPNRRLIASGMYVPGPKKDGTSEIAILIDTSGSVSHEMVSAFLAEINSIISSVTPSRVQVHWFESHVWKTELLSQGQLLRVPDEIQQGGTNFEEAFNAIIGNPRLVVCLTDMYDSFNFKPPRAKTIWVATTDVQAPWGTTIKIKL